MLSLKNLVLFLVSFTTVLNMNLGLFLSSSIQICWSSSTKNFSIANKTLLSCHKEYYQFSGIRAGNWGESRGLTLGSEFQCEGWCSSSNWLCLFLINEVGYLLSTQKPTKATSTHICSWDIQHVVAQCWLSWLAIIPPGFSQWERSLSAHVLTGPIRPPKVS